MKIRNSSNEIISKYWLYFGQLFNIGLLLYFKYVNFFIENINNLLVEIGFDQSLQSLSLIVPLGISFFTFQNIGYLIDVYNEECEPSKNWLEFSIYVIYFPKILSGPIERSYHFLPQLSQNRNFDPILFADGLRQILWGLFAKVVIAENCAFLANPIFNNPAGSNSIELFSGAFFYAIQLYADFAGYSNMAIGISKLLGIQLSKNFSTPYFKTNIADFWRSWHMTLTNWMMDYIFTPLSFTLRKRKKYGLIISIITTFILVGFWHGANWTFIVYGFLHGVYFLPLVLSKDKLSSVKSKTNTKTGILYYLKMFALFILVMLTAVIFNSRSLDHALIFYGELFKSVSLDNLMYLFQPNTLLTIGLIGFFLMIEWVNKKHLHDFEISRWSTLIRWCFYILIFCTILLFGRSSNSFIYFQF
ncbi:MBOAT family O-acyltransferase [Robiginitalea sp. IMCC43444]|uniref:MBOAT family O-acyltransferase n=1 Tax=Robiginitalea sp. IMCC43444 TaxID=3459121 RepID=UPI0040429679